MIAVIVGVRARAGGLWTFSDGGGGRGRSRDFIACGQWWERRVRRRMMVLGAEYRMLWMI